MIEVSAQGKLYYRETSVSKLTILATQTTSMTRSRAGCLVTLLLPLREMSWTRIKTSY